QHHKDKGQRGGQRGYFANLHFNFLFTECSNSIFNKVSTLRFRQGRYNGGVMEVFDGGNAKSPLEQVSSNLCAKITPLATA
ncbi:MAG: hypothetical protein ABF291_14620, partial [Desulfobacterales bacterium]